jgi:protein phosphatase
VALQAPTATDARPASPEGGAAAPAREPPERTAPLPKHAPPRGARRRRRRSGGGLLLLLAVVLPLIAGAWLASRAVYFVGTDPADGRTVAIFRGLPYELPFGVDLYERYYQSGVTLADVPPARRERFTDHRLRSRDDAEDLVIALEKDQLE